MFMPCRAKAVSIAAKASITVEVTDPSSAQTAQQDAAVAATQVLDALAAAGVPEADIATQGINVGPTYNYTADGGQTLLGYRAAQTITVTLRDLTRGPREYRDAKVAAKALADLVEVGILRRVVDDHGAKGGRPAERFGLVSEGGDTGDGDETP